MSGEGEGESSRQHWGDSAEAWARAAEEEETGASASATKWMLETAGLQAGDRVLELACGAGRVGLQAAEIIGPTGTVLCSDFAEGMVQAVRDRVGRTGVANVETRVLDAESLDLDDGSFDVVLCRFGYMLMGDPRRALAESRRVLHPGGRLVLAVWGSADDNPWLSLIFDATMSQLGAPPPEPGTPGPFALGDAAQLRQMVEEAGLIDVEAVEIEAAQNYGSLERWWDQLREVSGALAALLDALPAADAGAIKEAALDAGRQYVHSDGEPTFPASIVGAHGHRPD